MTSPIELEDLSERLVRANAMILGQLRSYDGIKALPAVIEAQSRAVDSVNGTLTELGGRVNRLDRAFQAEHVLETDRTLYTALALWLSVTGRSPDYPVRAPTRTRSLPMSCVYSARTARTACSPRSWLASGSASASSWSSAWSPDVRATVSI